MTKILLKDGATADFLRFEISYEDGKKFKIERDNENDLKKRTRTNYSGPKHAFFLNFD